MIAQPFISPFDVRDYSGVVLEVDEDTFLLVPGLRLTDHHHGHHLLPEHRLALLHEAHTHDVKLRHCDLVQAASDALLGHYGKILGVRVVRTIHDAHTDAYLGLGFVMVLVLVLVLSESSSWSLPAVGHALFTRCGSALSRSGCSFHLLEVLRCWCCRGFLFVLDCPDLCPLHVLTHMFISARSLTCYAWFGRPQPHTQEDSTPPGSVRGGQSTSSSACSWIPPWSLCIEGLSANGARQALLCSASRHRALVCSGSSCFRRHPSQVINLSTDTIVPAAVPAASWLCASWSVGSCSSRAAPVALITKSSRLTVLCTLSP